MDFHSDDDGDSDLDESTAEQTYGHPLFFENMSMSSTETLELHQRHLKEILRAQTRLMAYRVMWEISGQN